MASFSEEIHELVRQVLVKKGWNITHCHNSSGQGILQIADEANTKLMVVVEINDDLDRQDYVSLDELEAMGTRESLS